MNHSRRRIHVARDPGLLRNRKLEPASKPARPDWPLHEPLAQPPLNVLLAEVRAPELARLRRREPWGVKSAHDLVGEFALIGSERRRIAPVQSSSDVLLDHPLRASELVGALMQLPHLLEQRLEHLVVYRQERRTLTGGPPARFAPIRAES